MNKFRLLALLALLLPLSTSALAQSVVRGTVTDAETGQGLPGASILVQGTTTGTATNLEGQYSLTVPSLDVTLVVSYVGYVTQTIPLEGRTRLDVALAPAALSGEEVVVVGYTAQRRRDITGAVSSIDPEEIAVRKVTRIEESIKGRIAGVDVSTTGQPGEGARITIRGIGFMNNNEPLYVVDGLYLRQNPNLNPNDIVSLEVLKDASAAAQYGAQAANGVIVITTKRGQQGPNKLTFNSYYGYQEIPARIDMMNAQDWAEINRTAYANAGLPPMQGAVNPVRSTDWQDAIFQSGSIQNYNLGASGAVENASYFISGDYLKQDGAVVRTGFERYGLRVNSEIRKGILTLGENAAISRSVKQNMVGFPLVDAVRMLPTIPVYDSTTTSGFGYGSEANYTFGTNPLGMQVMQDNTNESNQVLGTAYAGLRLFDNLSYRFNLGFQYEDFTNKVFNRRGQLRLNNPLLPASLSHNRNNSSRLLAENLLTFDDAFGPHAVNAVAGYTQQREDFAFVGAYREGYNDEDLQVIEAGTDNLNNGGYNVTTMLRSFLVRANYSFADRYLLTGSFRRDGSSRFGADNRWGNFVSGSVGWVLSEEGFYQSLPVLRDYVDRFKVRASYGTLGNQDIGDYEFAGLIRQNISYVLGPDAIAPGAIQLSLANPNIRWQEKKQTDVGFDLNLFNYRVQLTADYYVSESKGLLVRAPLPPSLGSASSPFVNAGSVRNSGFELSTSYRYERPQAGFNAGFNLTTIKNEVLSLGSGNQPIFAGPWGVARTAVGGPVGSFYVLQTDGIFQNEAEVQAHTSTLANGQTVVIQPGAKPGDVRYRDRNGDGLINDEDRYVAGSAFPTLQGGFFLNGRYRMLDFSLGLRGSAGNEIFNVVRFWTDRMDDNANYRAGLKPWTPENPSTSTPRAIFGPAGAMNANPTSDRWIEDGSYLRLQNIEVGYTLPGTLAQRVGLSQGGVRIYANVQNLYTFTGYSGWDPENVGMGTLAPGFDDGQIFPNVRTFTLGLNLNL